MNERRADAEHAGFWEFITLMALSMSLVALSIDAMLPAFPQMAADLGVTGENDIQWVISALFIGLSAGQVFYGPLSDSIGRKPAIFIGYAIFLLGSLLSMVAGTFELMLLGRLLQGVGAAGPRTASLALIRDCFHGSEMARVTSFIMTVFILVPIFAPALGQAILLLAGWRAIFATFILLAVTVALWLAIRQPETLPPDRRKPFTLNNVGKALLEVFRHRVSVIYMLVTGCVSGAFLGYLNSSQQIFVGLYGLGRLFPLFFGLFAVSVGVAALLNGAMVRKFGMHRLANGALRWMMALSWGLLLVAWLFGGQPPLWLFTLIGLGQFFFIGILFGNLNSIAMEPLGHVAGTGASVIGSVTTLLAVGMGFVIGQAYDGSLLPMAWGFAVLISLSVLLTRRAETP